jgi:hypothetical protein
VFGLFKRWRRRRLARRPFPEAWYAHLERHVPFYGQLPESLRLRFLEMLKIFAREKHFEGARGLEMTDEMRVVVSAAAIRLVLHLDLSYYDRLTEIVVYPFDYRHPGEDDFAVFGEAHRFGTVVLSWPAVLRGLKDPHDGGDTATHEFAHVLDAADGDFDGAPILRHSDAYRPWAQVMKRHFDALGRGERAESRVLRDYGATNPAEFFAVATEAFFEKPRQMREHMPDLYAQLHGFYGFDPAFDERDGVPSGRPVEPQQSCPCGSGHSHRGCCGRVCA